MPRQPIYLDCDTGIDDSMALAYLLARDDVDYLHVRDTQAGCYDLRVERA